MIGPQAGRTAVVKCPACFQPVHLTNLPPEEPGEVELTGQAAWQAIGLHLRVGCRVAARADADDRLPRLGGT